MTDEIRAFYGLLGELERRLGGKRRLRDRNDSGLPERGVYFFFEDGETRTGSGDGPRVVRVGTHMLKSGSKATLRSRLSQHRGNLGSGGNHRGSIFRLIVGDALKRRGSNRWAGLETWGVGSDLGTAARKSGLDRSEVRERETPMEDAVSAYIGAMPFLWVEVDDEAGPGSDRGVIERNAIALLSAPGCIAADPASPSWLGRHSSREPVVRSGLWNNRHVGDGFDPGFLKTLDKRIAHTTRP